MDMREARRAAEKAARERISERVRIAGELGVLLQRRSELGEAVHVAQIRADELVQVARDAGGKLVEAASANLDEADSLYRSAYATALSTGWSTDELVELGFEARPSNVTVATQHRTNATLE